MIPAYIALGSNLLDPENQLRQAVKALQELPETRLEQVSSVYSSAAIGPGTQPDYLNAAVLLRTQLTPLALLDCLQRIEREQNRVREIRWGPRTIDLDILLYADVTITSPRLILPHPRMEERQFMLYPLHEISGDNLILPDGRRLDALLKQCPRDALVKTTHRLWHADTTTEGSTKGPRP